MAFAQLTFRESLRDIEDCLAARSDQLYHLGFRSRVCRSTLADANEVRDWRIYADLAALLIKKANILLNLDSRWALDSTREERCTLIRRSTIWGPPYPGPRGYGSQLESASASKSILVQVFILPPLSSIVENRQIKDRSRLSPLQREREQLFPR